MISKVQIRNFRSIGVADIPTTPITVLVGENDAGKSNVLRALNLFFNNETDLGLPLNFISDFNQNAKVGLRKAKEVQVALTLNLPATYLRPDLPAQVIWSKSWREDSLAAHEDTKTYVGGMEFPSRSKISALLDRVRFTYIPAVKDKIFFTDLQGRLYDVLSSVAAAPLRESANIFEQQLQEQLSKLLSSISNVFSGESIMRLPDNLREIFESLEISSGGIPLSRRGDGIKIRHIPMLLGFISQKQDEILNRGGVRYTHIWGFEEPENSVEMSACFKMADNLVNMVNASENYQLILTTHSPIFYRIDKMKGCSGYNTIFVEKNASETVLNVKNSETVDEVMGPYANCGSIYCRRKKTNGGVETAICRCQGHLFT